MRLFVGLDLPTDVVQSLDQFQRRLRPLAKLSWSAAENLHITTKFIGEWPADRLNEVKNSLAALPSRESLEIRVRGLGFFPNERSPRVFWAGIEAPPGLAGLAKETDVAMGKLGIVRESRAFSPHLTLARIRTPVPMTEMMEQVDAHRQTGFGDFTVDRFFLYLSERHPSGSVYTKLAEYPFSL